MTRRSTQVGMLSERPASHTDAATKTKKIGKKMAFWGTLIAAFFLSFNIQAQSTNASVEEPDTAAFLPATQQGQNLDLAAVLDVFQNSKGLEDFEKELNKQDGINNLDLNGDSIIDYIRVMEKEEGEYRVIVMQSIIGENEFQDVAYINIKRSSEKEIDVQVEGSSVVYGDNYYVAPRRTVHVHVHTWPVWSYMYVPHYRYYHSPYYWGYYPRYWHRYHYRPYHSYRSTMLVYRNGYYYSRTVIVPRPRRVYTPKHSKRVVLTPVTPVGSRRPAATGGNGSSGARKGTVQAPRQTVGGRNAKPGAPARTVNEGTNRAPRTVAPASKAPRTVKPGAPKASTPRYKARATAPRSTAPASPKVRSRTSPSTGNYHKKSTRAKTQPTVRKSRSPEVRKARPSSSGREGVKTTTPRKQSSTRPASSRKSKASAPKKSSSRGVESKSKSSTRGSR